MKDATPVFPNQESEHMRHAEGMQLRDYFAAHASEEDIVKHRGDPDHGKTVIRSAEKKAEHARMLELNPIKSREAARYAYADAMMAERLK